MRIKLAVLLSVTAVLPMGCGGGGSGTADPAPRESPSPADEEANEDVVAAFESYRSAAIAQDGERAVELASSESLDYYDEMRQMALTAPREELKRRRLIDRVMVLMLRHMIEPAKLEAMDGADVFVLSIEEGLTSEASVEKMEPGDVDVSGDRAVMAVEINGEPGPFAFPFVRQEGDWKIDFSELLAVGDAGFRSLVEQSGMSQNEFLMEALTSVSGTRPPKSIWDPPSA